MSSNNIENKKLEKKIPVIAVVGPTASGKTAVSIEIAKRYNGEIVSADSMQIYKKMNIGTAKPTKEEMQGIPHHLMDCIELEQSFSLGDYVKLAHEVIADIHNRGKLPIVVGGTGLYIDTLLNDITLNEFKSDEKIRIELEQFYKENGTDALFQILKEIDPISSNKIEKNNIPRVIRAIEVFKLTGKTIYEHQLESRKNPSRYQSLIIGLNFKDRQKLYDRINQRVDLMMEQGLLEEAKEILSNKNATTAHQAIAYKEFADYFNHKITLKEAVDRLKQSSRRYAKRQLTWFKRNNNIVWFYTENNESNEKLQKNMINSIEKFL